MRPPRGLAAAMLAAFAPLLAGCGSNNGRPITSAGVSDVRCGEAPVLGRPLADARSYVVRLPGTPDGIATTPDGRTSFIALQSGAPRIAVVGNGGTRSRVLRTFSVPAYASGMRVTPNGRYALGAMGRGAAVVDVARAGSRTANPVLGVLAVPHSLRLAAPRAAEVAISADSRHAFVTLEGAGAVAVFDLRAAARGGFGSAGFVGSIPVGAGALGITTSPDGKWLYEVSESGGQRSRKGLGRLNVIDLSQATKDPAHSVVGTTVVPCAPVRVAVSPTGGTVWVTARDADALLGFSAAELRRRGGRPLISITRVGAQPLGVAIAADGRRALVCDSDLSDSPGSRSAVSVVDVSSPTRPVLLGSVPAGTLADAISTRTSAGPAQVTASASKQLDVLDLQRLP